jgi:deazaflavin-dependent oxidoreductase (nitroreductase family)
MAASEPTLVRERPNPLLKVLFKFPVPIYRGPIAELLKSRCVLRLTTIGRRSGQPRTVCVSFMPLEGRYVVFSGFGIHSHWYQNLRANPEVTMQVGRQRLRATAHVVEDPGRRRELMERMRARSRGCGPPTWIRPLLRLTRTFDYDAEIRLATERAEELPVVELVPHGSAG